MAEFGIDSSNIVGLTTTAFGIVVVAFSFAYKIIMDAKDKKTLIKSHQKLIKNTIKTDDNHEENNRLNKENSDKITEVIVQLSHLMQKIDNRLEALEKNREQ